MTNSLSLTDTQLVLLSQASQHPEGKIVPPVHLRGGVFRRVMASLAGKGLVQSAPVPADGTMDRSGDTHAEACPVISAAGLAALGITVEGGAESAVEASALETRAKLGTKPEVPAGSNPTADLAPADSLEPDPAQHPRAGSKQAQVLALLAHPEGAALDALMAATGWLSHTVRAVLSGLRKRGYAIDRSPGGEGGSCRYRLVVPVPESAVPDPSAAASAPSVPEYAA